MLQLDRGAQSYYRDLYIEALKELIAYHGERNDHELVIRYGQMFLARDPYQEDVHCNVMEAHVRSGNRAAAIEQFDGLLRASPREISIMRGSQQLLWDPRATFGPGIVILVSGVSDKVGRTPK